MDFKEFNFTPFEFEDEHIITHLEQSHARLLFDSTMQIVSQQNWDDFNQTENVYIIAHDIENNVFGCFISNPQQRNPSQIVHYLFSEPNDSLRIKSYDFRIANPPFVIFRNDTIIIDVVLAFTIDRNLQCKINNKIGIFYMDTNIPHVIHEHDFPFPFQNHPETIQLKQLQLFMIDR